MKPAQTKLELLERLVREGHITLAEAFDLSETEKEYVYISQYKTYNPQFYENPFRVTCGTTSTLYNVQKLEDMFNKAVDQGIIEYKK
jgi:hypothetical protein